MGKECKGLCGRFLIQNIQRPIYVYQRRCSKCECWVNFDMVVCDCCKNMTRGKPYKSGNRQKYIVLQTNTNVGF